MRKTILSIAVMAVAAGYAASPQYSRVVDYVPAPGQFINTLPEWEDGDDAAAMAEKVYEFSQDGSLTCLGAYGGYVTVAFDKTIVNVAGERDIYIMGNAFQASSSTTAGGSSEPGVVMVAYDINQNGVPDDNEWFEIAGSEYANSTRGYEITYYRPAADTDDIQWVDNQGNTGWVYRNAYHSQPYWPQWRDEETIVFKGTRLPDNGVNEGTSSSPYYVLSRFDYGYADNYPNYTDDDERNPGAMIDIGWAVDSDGNSVEMPGVDFVRIYTGVNQSNGWLGENSTEMENVYNTHTTVVDGVEVVDETVTVDADVLAEFLSKYGSVSAAELDNSGVRVYVDSSGTVRFTLNQPDAVAVYNQAGALMHSEACGAGTHSIDISGYPSGLYVVKAGSAAQKILKR